MTTPDYLTLIVDTADKAGDLAMRYFREADSLDVDFKGAGRPAL